MQLKKSTLQFLSDIRENNNRDWFAEHKPRYQAAYANVNDFAQHVKELLSATDEIENAKVFRIYRDVRFSKNKDPYKINLGAGFTRASALRRGGYYLHIEPGGCFAGGGFWAPESKDLKRVRQEIDRNADELRAIINEENFVQHFGELAGDEVKSAPRGYAKDHPAIDLLRKKQYLAMRSFTDKQATSKHFAEEVHATFLAMRPFFDYMSDVLTTDLNGELVV